MQHLDSIEVPIKTAEARKRLGCGASRFSAIKRRLGICHQRFVMFSQIAAFLAANPTFQEKEVYKRKTASAQSVGAVGQVVGSQTSVGSEGGC